LRYFILIDHAERSAAIYTAPPLKQSNQRRAIQQMHF
jgi:hypothetical protein